MDLLQLFMFHYAGAKMGRTVWVINNQLELLNGMADVQKSWKSRHNFLYILWLVLVSNFNLSYSLFKRQQRVIT